MDGSIVQSLTQEPDRTEASVRLTTKLRIFQTDPSWIYSRKMLYGICRIHQEIFRKSRDIR